MHTQHTPMMRAAAAAVAALALAGCGSTGGGSRPQHYRQTALTEMDFYTVDASQRLAYSQVYRVEGQRRIRRVCSEPPPDVMTSFTESLKFAAEAAAKAKETDVTASLDLTRHIATAVSRLYTRSHAIQLFRDGAFMLCQAHLNGAMLADYFTDQAVNYRVQAEKRLDQAMAAEKSGNEKLAEKHFAEADRLEERAIASEAKATQDTQNSNNYSQQFQALLTATQALLKDEIDLLYKFDGAAIKQAAVAAQEQAEKAARQAAADKAVVSAAETDARTAKAAAAANAKAAAASAKAASESAQAAAQSAQDAAASAKISE